jgi:segregation and condensation protein A
MNAEILNPKSEILNDEIRDPRSEILDNESQDPGSKQGNDYFIEIDTFVGPFDVLLKAIDAGEIDIFNISITQITASYFDYWRETQPSLILASDFLTMAAYLLELKSKALLPLREEEKEEDMEQIEESLVSHIQEYEVFKNLAKTLKERKEVFEKVYGRHEGEKMEREFELVNVSLKDLVVAFKRVYDEAAKREKIVQIVADEVSLEDRIIEIKNMLAGRKDGVPFEDIFIRRTRLEIVVTFLAILELAKQRFIALTQGRRFGSILIFAREIMENEHTTGSAES